MSQLRRDSDSDTKMWAKSRSHSLQALIMWSCCSSILSLRPELLGNQSVTMCHIICLHFAESKFQIMLHPKIAGIRSLPPLILKDLQGLVPGKLRQPERWKSCQKKAIWQCEINCHVKVGVNWNYQSHFQVSDVEFAPLRFVDSLGWQKSQRRGWHVVWWWPRIHNPPALLDWGRPILAAIYLFSGTSPKENKHGLWIKGWH